MLLLFNENEIEAKNKFILIMAHIIMKSNFTYIIGIKLREIYKCSTSSSIFVTLGVKQSHIIANYTRLLTSYRHVCYNK